MVFEALLVFEASGQGRLKPVSMCSHGCTPRRLQWRVRFPVPPHPPTPHPLGRACRQRALHVPGASPPRRLLPAWQRARRSSLVAAPVCLPTCSVDGFLFSASSPHPHTPHAHTRCVWSLGNSPSDRCKVTFTVLFL